MINESQGIMKNKLYLYIIKSEKPVYLNIIIKFIYELLKLNNEKYYVYEQFYSTNDNIKKHNLPKGFNDYKKIGVIETSISGDPLLQKWMRDKTWKYL